MRHDAIIVGSGSGTTPRHVRRVAEEPLKPRAIPQRPITGRLFDLEPLEPAS